MTWTQVMQAAVMWGPGILILAGIFVLVRRPPEFVGQFIDAQKSQAVAMSKMATAVEHVGERGNILEQQVVRKLDELLINDQIFLRRLEEMDRRMANGPR